ncbi:MAG: AI-2E family transporter [Deltaproteobacteria bacterium]|nr:AI-2E family transporter [Deltaproteobacteria bacterium]
MTEPLAARRRIRQYTFIALSALLFLTLLVVARGVLLPFILGLFIAYMIEPLVRRASRIRSGRRLVPRWLAIIAVYAVFLGALTVFSTQFIPLVVNEIGKLIPETKKFVNELKTVHVPVWNKKIQEFIRSNFPPTNEEAPVDATKSERVAPPWADEWMKAGERAREEALRAAVAPDPAAVKAREAALSRAAEEGATFIVTPAKQGWAIRLRDVAFEIKKDSDNRILITPRDPSKPIKKGAREKGFDLERAVEKGIHDLVESAAEHVGDYIVVGQKIVSNVFDAVVGIVITLMIAAFMSIGADRIHAFLRSLVPARHGDDYDRVIARLDSGLSGVIRGQIVVCLLNGVLTALGLFGVAIVYGEPVKFAAILSVLATVMSLIPIFGMIISGAPAVLFALTQSPYLAIFVVVWILLIHFIEANVLNPRIVGKSAQMNPVVVIFALLAGQHLYGVTGALLSVPIASIIQTFYLFLKAKLYDDDNGASDAAPVSDVPPASPS